jgi:hypothetical protein
VGGGQAVAARGGVHVRVVGGQEAGDGLLLEPLAHVALGGAGAGGEFTRRRIPAVGECTVEAEPTTEVDRRDLQGVDGGGEQALHQRVGRDTRRRVGSADFGHRGPPSGLRRKGGEVECALERLIGRPQHRAPRPVWRLR